MLCFLIDNQNIIISKHTSINISPWDIVNHNNITDMSTDNALKGAADEYLRKHRIIELM